MERQVAMLLQQVMEVSDRLRLSGGLGMWDERMNRTEASVRDPSQAGGSSAARAQEAPGADDGRIGFGAFAARYQPENFNSEDTGWRDCFRVFHSWAGLFQRGRVLEIIRSVEARFEDEATVADKFEDWGSAELKSVVAVL